jgi:tetratricopeptide (TPR) repeat protein
MHIDAPSLMSFLTRNRYYDPATLPVYYALEYLWYHYVAASILSLRLLSVSVGLATIPVVYVLGKALDRPLTGLIAAACFALSPIHAFHAQGIRMYVLFTLFAALSAWSFVRVWQEPTKKRLWAIHLFVQFVFLWIHPFAALLVMVEGLVALTLVPKAWKPSIAWFVLTGLVSLPFLYYLSGMRYWPKNLTESWLRTPTFDQFLRDLFADDVVYGLWQVRICTDAFGWLPTALRSYAFSMRPAFDALLIGISLLSLVFGALIAFAPSRFGDIRKNSLLTPAQRYGFLFLWLILPAATLYVLSLVWRPCIFPRYTVHSSIALYVLLGMFVTHLPKRGWRLFAGLVTLLLFAYQNALTHPGPQRTDWQGAARLILEQGGPKDVILAYVSINRDVLLYNLTGRTNTLLNTALPADNVFFNRVQNLEYIIGTSSDMEALSRQALTYLRLLSRLPLEDLQRRTLWVVMTGEANRAPLDTVLQQNKLYHEIIELPGMETLWVYKIPCNQATTLPQENSPCAPFGFDRTHTEQYTSMALSLAESGEYELALALFSMAYGDNAEKDVEYGPLVRALKQGQRVDLYLQSVRKLNESRGIRAGLVSAELGSDENLLREVIAATPDFTYAYDELIERLLDRGALEEAEKIARQMPLPENPPLFSLRFARLAQVAQQGGDFAKALEAFKHFADGYAAVQEGRITESTEAFAKAYATDPENPLIAFAYAVSFSLVGDVRAFRENMEKVLAKFPNVEEMYGAAYRALFIDNDPNRAEKEIQRLQCYDAFVPPIFLQQLETLKQGTGQ